MLLFWALRNAQAAKWPYKWGAFIDTYLLDEFSYAHKYFKKWK